MGSAQPEERIDVIENESSLATSSPYDYRWWETGIVVSPFVIAFLIFMIFIITFLYLYKPFIPHKTERIEDVDAQGGPEYTMMDGGIAKSEAEKPEISPV
jgi:hypothetical protein